MNKLQLTKKATLLASLLTLGTSALYADSDLKKLLDEGKVNLDVRTRYEYTDVGANSFDGVSIRTRLGFTTGEVNGFQAKIEMEDVSVPFGIDQPNPLDVDATELNQLWLSYKNEDFGSAKLGRQIIAYDDHRFIGHVGWRQNIQTYDAFATTFDSVENLWIKFAYLDSVNRVNATEQDLAGYLLNTKYKFSKYLNLTGFIYSLDFDSFSKDSDTFGLRATGMVPLEDFKLSYTGSFATQSQNGFDSYNYYALEVKGAYKEIGLWAGFEVLEGDATSGFSTPLATIHKFQGFADKFAGPGIGGTVNGIQDIYFGASYKIPVGKGIVTQAIYHLFEPENGSGDYGTEIDFLVAYNINKSFKIVSKYGNYSADDNAVGIGAGDREFFSLELNFKY